jgi:hypothetical protein
LRARWRPCRWRCRCLPRGLSYRRGPRWRHDLPLRCCYRLRARWRCCARGRGVFYIKSCARGWPRDRRRSGARCRPRRWHHLLRPRWHRRRRCCWRRSHRRWLLRPHRCWRRRSHRRWRRPHRRRSHHPRTRRGRRGSNPHRDRTLNPDIAVAHATQRELVERPLARTATDWKIHCFSGMVEGLSYIVILGDDAHTLRARRSMTQIACAEHSAAIS